MLRLINFSLTKVDNNMCNDWMIDVLKDMRQVALKNAMLNLAEQLDDAIVVAALELKERGEISTVEEYDRENRNSFGMLGGYGETERSPRPC